MLTKVLSKPLIQGVIKMSGNKKIIIFGNDAFSVTRWIKQFAERLTEDWEPFPLRIICINASYRTMSKSIIQSTWIANIFYKSDCPIPRTYQSADSAHFGPAILNSSPLTHIFSVNFQDFFFLQLCYNIFYYWWIKTSKIIKTQTHKDLPSMVTYTRIRFDVVFV